MLPNILQTIVKNQKIIHQILHQTNANGTSNLEVGALQNLEKKEKRKQKKRRKMDQEKRKKGEKEEEVGIPSGQKPGKATQKIPTKKMCKRVQIYYM